MSKKVRFETNGKVNASNVDLKNGKKYVLCDNSTLLLMKHKIWAVYKFVFFSGKIMIFKEVHNTKSLKKYYICSDNLS